MNNDDICKELYNIYRKMPGITSDDNERLLALKNEVIKGKKTLAEFEYAVREISLYLSEDLDHSWIKARIISRDTAKEAMNYFNIDMYRFGIEALSNAFLQCFHVRTLRSDSSPEMFVYSKGIYVSDGCTILKQFLRMVLENHYSTRIVADVRALIEVQSYVNRENFYQENSAFIVPLKNGLLNLKTRCLYPFNPSQVFFAKLPIKFDPDAKCPKIDAFISQVVVSEDIPLLQEMAGYCLLKQYNFHKAFMLVGVGSNGKSTFLKLLKAILGQENISAVALQTLYSNRFAAAQLHGKMANLFADLPSVAITDTGMFKMLVGEDPIPAEKKFKDGFQFYNYAKLIFSANQVPRSDDDTDAFYRRWIIIMFPYQFGITANDPPADENLFSTITTDSELSGFLNHAVEGLHRLLKDGHFSYKPSVAEVREAYLRMSDSVAAFGFDCVDLDPEAIIEKTECLRAYRTYCKESKYPAVSEKKFWSMFPEAFPTMITTRISKQEGLKTVRIVCVRGIKVRNVRDVRDVRGFSQLNARESFGDIKMEKMVDIPDMVDSPITITNQIQILDFIRSNPKCHFRDIQMKCSPLIGASLDVFLKHFKECGDIAEFHPDQYEVLA